MRIIGSPIHSCIGMIVAVAAWRLAPGGSGPEVLRQAIERYETSVEKIGESGTTQERAQSIAALAALASPRVASVRVRWRDDSAPEVRQALLAAITRLGDKSEAARSIVIESLKNDDDGVLGRALQAFQQLKLRVKFQAVWRPERPLRLWIRHERTGSPTLISVDGINAVRPWRDAAWKSVSPRLRLSLLARAGSKEAFSLLLRELRAHGREVGGFSNVLVPAEEVDVAFLRSHLDDAQPEIGRYAALSLIAGHDPAFLAMVSHCLMRSASDGLACPASALDERVLRAAMLALDRQALLAFERRDPVRWFWEVHLELLGRGEPFSFEELDQRVQRLRTQPPPAPDRSTSSTGFSLAGYSEILKRERAGAMVREGNAAALERLIQETLAEARPLASLRDLNGVLWAAPDFLAALPPDIAHRSFERVRKWIGRRTPERSDPGSDDTGIVEAWKTAGMLARDGDADDLWKELRESKDPLRDMPHLTPLLWGATRRSESLRGLLASAQRQGWFGGSFNFHDLLEATEPDPAPPDPCRGRRTVPSWDPFELPSLPSSLARVRQELASDLDHVYPSRDAKALARDFLELRGEGRRIVVPLDVLDFLLDPREPVFKAAQRLLAAVGLPPRGAPGEELSAAKRAWLAEWRTRLGRFPTGRAPLPGPELEGEEKAWLEGVADRERETYFERLMDFRAPLEIVCGGQPPSPALVSLPSGAFLGAVASFQDRVRALMTSPDDDLRHAAAWALWLRLRDNDALRVWRQDARSPDLVVRARSLNVLRTIRDREAAPLFPPLLRDPSPELRQIGLWGVQAFEIRDALPDAENLILDDNRAVAETAIEVLGALRPPEALPLLSRLLGTTDRIRWKASTVLPSFRTRSEMDAMVARLADASLPDSGRWEIVGALTRITNHPPRQLWNQFALSPVTAHLEAGTIREYQQWWGLHRNDSAEKWFKDALARLVERVAKGDDTAATMATRDLARIAWDLRSYPNGFSITPREREAIRQWWEQNRASDPWAILAGGAMVPDTNLDLAFDVDPMRVRRQLIGPLLGTPRVDGPWVGYPDVWYQNLVRFAGVDLGDPVLALCDTRDTLTQEWLAWARREGWIP